MFYRISFIVFFITVNFYFTNAQVVLVDNLSDFDTAVAVALPGDTIALKDGFWANDVLKFYAEGEEGSPIVLTAETPGKVILTGSSRLEIFGKYLEVHNLDFKNGALENQSVVSFRKDANELAENCRLTNCRIINYNPATDDFNYKWVSLYGKNNRVDHCHFAGKNHEGALLVVWLNGEANFHRIDHNYFSDIPELGRNGGETIRIGTSTFSMTESRTIVEYNLFEACDGELEIISNKSHFNIYRYNTFRNSNGVLTLRHGNDCDVYSNFFFGGSGKNSGGVRIIGERHKVYNNYFQDLEGSGTRAAICMMNGVEDSPLNRYFQVKDAEVIHNTIVNCEQAFAFGVGSNEELTLPPLNCMIANNVATQLTGSDPISYIDTPINISYESNYIFSDDVSIDDEGIINEDPGLTMNNNLWRPNISSVIYNATIFEFEYVNDDLDGQSRTDIPEIGCDEISDEDIVNVPLFPEDVGQDWADVDANIVTKYTKIPVKYVVKENTLYVSDLPEKNIPYNLTVFNTDGQQIIRDTLHQSNAAIPLRGLQGIYVVKLTGGMNAHNVQKVLF